MPGSDHDRGGLPPVKYETTLKKWNHGRTPEDGEPDEIITDVSWSEVDGSDVTDPARIAELEAKLAAREAAKRKD